MIYKNEEFILDELTRCANSNRHTILIDGIPGIGKTYMAKEYAKLLQIKDVVSLSPVVSDIRDALNQFIQLSNKILVIIENLDSGMLVASHALLKFIEEPPENIYIIITCHNFMNIPDTIISRSYCITMSCTTPVDIQKYATQTNAAKYGQMIHLPIWKMVRTFTDVDIVFSLTTSQIDYLAKLPALTSIKESISGLSWKYSHYVDGTAIPTSFILNYIYCTYDDIRIKTFCHNAIKDLDNTSIASHVVLSKFLLECKYNLI